MHIILTILKITQTLIDNVKRLTFPWRLRAKQGRMIVYALWDA